MFFRGNNLKVVIILLTVFTFVSKAEHYRFVAEDLPPYHFIDSHGQVQGAFVDIVKAVANQAKIKYSIELYPFARALKLFETKSNVLMFSLLKSPSREKQFIWLGKVFHNTAYLVSVKGTKPPLLNLEQAKRYTVGTIRGYFSETYLRSAGFQEGSNLSLSVKYQSLWRMLFNDRIDFVLTNTISLNQELNTLGYRTDDIERRLVLDDFPSELHLAGNLSIDPSSALALQKALVTIKDNGEYLKILNDWGLSELKKEEALAY